jgi:hypothetical protein
MFGKALGDTQGGWDVENWRNALHHQWRVKDGKEELFFTSPNTIDQVFRDAGAMAARANVENRLNQHFVDKKILVHFGTEDTQWSYLDMNMLGDRHWGRRGGDKLTRAKTITLMMQHFDLLVGKPEMDKLIEAIAKIGQTEKGHDPKEAAKLSYLWGVGTHDMYKQRLLAGAPLIGRVLPSLGVPMSIAQQRAGIDSATFWSINNSLEYAHKLGQTRVIPEKQIVDGRDYGPYTMVRFRKDIGASKALAATEMFVIGYAITALLISLYAAKEGTEEEKKR